MLFPESFEIINSVDRNLIVLREFFFIQYFNIISYQR